jgi:hypothetical protein
VSPFTVTVEDEEEEADEEEEEEENDDEEEKDEEEEEEEENDKEEEEEEGEESSFCSETRRSLSSDVFSSITVERLSGEDDDGEEGAGRVGRGDC